jgi:ribosome recycling factor
MTEDECKSTQEDVQKLVKKFEDKCNELAKSKEAEVMND